MKKVLFVPSAGINPVNGLPPENTLARCKAGLKLWLTGKYDLILATGGVFNPPHVQTRPAGELMKEWFIVQGVPKESVLAENKSLDTFENVYCGLEMLFAYGRPEITVVTQWQHALRFWVTFRLGYGISVKLAPISYPLSWREHLHEFFSFLYHLHDPRGIGNLAVKNRLARRNAAQNSGDSR